MPARAAKLRADDPPDALAPARALIAGGARFRRVRPLFAGMNDAFACYAAAQQELYAAAHGCCVACGGGREVGGVEITWRMVARRAGDWVMVVVGALSHFAHDDVPYRRFRTRHALCDACLRRWRRGRIGWVALFCVGVLFLSAGGVAAVMGLILGYGGTWKPSERPIVILTGWAGLASVALGLWLAQWSLARQAPRALRHIGSWPIQLESLEPMPWDESQPDWILLTDKPLPVADAIAGAYAEAAGGVDAFLGTTRAENNDDGQDLLALDYEAYAEMAVQQMHDLARGARQRWPIERLAILHRLGRVAVAQPSVAIVVSCPHRAEAFEACRWIIDTLKKDVAIWKKEVWADGSGTWVHPEK